MKASHAQFSIEVHVAAFSADNDALVVGLMPGDEFTLPKTSLIPDLHLDDAARNVFVWPKNEATIEPLVWQIETQNRNKIIQVGYAAVAPLITLQESGFKILNFAELPSAKMDPYDVDLAANACRDLQFLTNITYQGTEQAKNILPILARLVPNPRKFRIKELYNAAIAIMQPEEGAVPDESNFGRWAKASDIQPTKYQYQPPTGRPATLYTMPPSALN